MKLGWPGALVILVGFLSLVIYLVVDKALLENEPFEKGSIEEDINKNDSKVPATVSNESKPDDLEIDPVVTSNIETSSFKNEDLPEEKVDGKELPKPQVLEEQFDATALNKNQLIVDDADIDKDLAKQSQKDKNITNIEVAKNTESSQEFTGTDKILKEEEEDSDKLTANILEPKNYESTEELETTKDLKSGNLLLKGGNRDKEQQSNQTKVDILRIDESGIAVIAGKAEPESSVEARIGSEIVGTSETSEDGNFVIIGQISSSDDAQELKLLTRDAKDENQEELKDTHGASDPAWVVSSNSFFILPGLIQQLEGGKTKNDEKLNALSIVEVTEDDLLVKQNPFPVKVEKVSLDRIRYSSEGVAILYGRCRSDMSVFVYLNNILRTKIDPAEDGSWTVDLGIVTPGVYTLRLDEVDSEGAVLSRIESPFKQEPKDLLDKIFADAITVQPGNSLWRIARRIYGRGIMYLEIYEKNDHLIKNPDLIYPGQVFSLLD